MNVGFLVCNDARVELFLPLSPLLFHPQTLVSVTSSIMILVVVQSLEPLNGPGVVYRRPGRVTNTGLVSSCTVCIPMPLKRLRRHVEKVQFSLNGGS